MRGFFVLWIAVLLALSPIALFTTPAEASESLRGSPESMKRQHKVAVAKNLTFVTNADEVTDLVEQGELVVLAGNDHYTVLESVSHPYARPELRLFIERLAEQYHEANGEKLVVTSLTRATEDQPWNAHPLSVHPAGLAVDLRISQKAKSRQWLESVLLKLERTGVLDATREKRPPHYHIALFPPAYQAHVVKLIGVEALAEALKFETEVEPVEEEVAATEDTVSVQALAPLLTSHTPPVSRRSAAAAIPLLVVACGIGFWAGKRYGTRKIAG